MYKTFATGDISPKETTVTSLVSKTFTLHFRYRDADGTGPHDHFVDIYAPSIKEAKCIGKSWEGREDQMTWFMGLRQ